MKILSSTITLTLLSSILVLQTSCKKGDTGPAGPVGPQGSQGIQGTQGVQGTANVIYSEWLPVTLDWGIYAFVYYGSISAPKLTQEILDKGDVRLYFLTGSGVYAIPHALLPDLSYSSSVGKIEIISPTKWDIVSGYKYRYVLIPGGAAARSSRAINWDNYYEVCSYLNIAP